MNELVETFVLNASLDEQMWVMLTLFGLTFMVKAFGHSVVDLWTLMQVKRNGASLEIAWDRWHNRLAMLLTQLFLVLLGVIVGLAPSANPPTARGAALRFMAVGLAFYLTLNAQRSEHARQRLNSLRNPDGHKD